MKLPKIVWTISCVIIGLEVYVIAALQMADSKGIWFPCLVTGVILALITFVLFEIKKYVLAGVFGFIALIAGIMLFLVF